MQEYTMVIPTYWGRSADGGLSAGIVFDHPTLLHEPGTLGRLLESLDILDEFQGKVVIISTSNEPGLTEQVAAKVESIITPYRQRYDIFNVCQGTLESLRKRLAQKGVSAGALAMLNLDNYASVRNICSLAGILTGSDYTIFIDDDEVFTDPDFLQKIDEDVGLSVEGRRIEALAGYYLQPKTYRLDEGKVPAWRAPYWNNTVAMNMAFDKIIGRPPRLKPTPFVFGGNMTISLKALRTVPFDPHITRGEDIDFLLNLRINGIGFYLDRELSIQHLPPASSQPAWKKVREDGVRFLYERQKVRDHSELKLDELQPYPGMFLADDLEERIIKTNELLIQDYESKNDRTSALECEKTIAQVKENPWARLDTKTHLSSITADWQELTSAAVGMGIP